MKQDSLVDIIRDQTERALWEVGNVIDCIPDERWDREYCGMPMWKHVYHLLHSLDLWYINPNDQRYEEPVFHVPNLNDLNTPSDRRLNRETLGDYFTNVKKKIAAYNKSLSDGELLAFPPNCSYTRFTLILAQFRHLHSHMGMLMGFIIDDTGKWPFVVGLTADIPTGKYDKYY